jgi:16S rRNA G966 N2-methylase RsmD
MGMQAGACTARILTFSIGEEMATPAKRAPRPGRLRIIGGQWRGRRLQFPAVEGLRPTPDRVRETLFNWLAPTIHGARCADLFAGSGALGLEALSRGAASCDFVDTSGAAVRAIASHLQSLDAEARGRCYRARAADYINRAGKVDRHSYNVDRHSSGGHKPGVDRHRYDPGVDRHRYDLVFLDPPFGRGLVQPTIDALVDAGALTWCNRLSTRWWTPAH